MLGLIVAVLTLTVLTADLTVYLAGRSRAQTAADAAALAAAPATFNGTASSAPRAAAVSLAAANRARLVECVCPLNRTWAARTVRVTVTVEVAPVLLTVQEVRATAAATFEPSRLRR